MATAAAFHQWHRLVSITGEPRNAAMFKTRRSIPPPPKAPPKATPPPAPAPAAAAIPAALVVPTEEAEAVPPSARASLFEVGTVRASEDGRLHEKGELVR